MRITSANPMALLTYNPIRDLILSKLSAHPTCACLNSSLRAEMALARGHRGVADRLHVYPFQEQLRSVQESHGHRVERLRALIAAQGGSPAESIGFSGWIFSRIATVAVLVSERLAVAVLRTGEEYLGSSYDRRQAHLNDDSRRVIDAEILPMQKATIGTLRGLTIRL